MIDLPATVDLLHLFGDATRVRLMALLEHEELTVAELTGITELSQSRVSSHLGRLREAGLLRVRKMGASTFYSVDTDAMPAAAQRMWGLVARQVADDRLEADRQRCAEVVQARHAAASWPESVAGEMDRHYSPGRTWESVARALLGFIRLGEVLDVGSGDGTMAELVAPRAARVVCFDKSERMISAARKRLVGQGNVDFRVGDMHALPFEDAAFDAVALFNVLTYSHNPTLALAESARVLRSDGALVIVTLNEHNHADVAGRYGHIHSGFSPGGLKRAVEAAGLAVDHCEVVARERRKPHFEVITAFARKRGAASNGARPAESRS